MEVRDKEVVVVRCDWEMRRIRWGVGLMGVEWVCVLVREYLNGKMLRVVGFV